MPTPREAEVINKIQALIDREYAGDYRIAFDYYDSNSDGKVDVPELTALLYTAQIGNALTRWKWCREIIDAMDMDSDGMISWEEFQAKLIRKA